MGLRIDQLSSLPLTSKQLLPKIPALYFVISEAEQVLYVGATQSLGTRWQSHHRLRQLDQYANVRIAWLPVADSAERQRLERQAIEQFQPLFNETPVPRMPGDKVTVGFKCSPQIFAVIRGIAKAEDRAVSTVIRRLLVSHPQIKAILQRQKEGAK